MKNLLLLFALGLPLSLHAQDDPWADVDSEPETEAPESADEAAPDGESGNATEAEAERPELEGEPITEPSAPPIEDLATIPVATPPDPEEAEPGRAQLDEVVVTAQKVKQPLRKVPVSVTSLNGDAIRNNGSATLADVSLYVPNVRIDVHDIGSPQVFIRGFGTNAFNPSFEGSVAFVQDEIYFGRPGYITESMFDVDRVEVLRGSQGTLFGKNTVAGVFNVWSRRPDKELGGDGQCFIGQHAEQRCEGGVDAFLGNWGGARLSFLARRSDGQLYNQFTDRNEEELDQKAGRLKVLLFPLDTVESELTLSKSQTDAPFWPYQLKNLDADTRTYLEGFDPDVEDDPTNFITSFDTIGFIDKGSTTGGLKTTWAATDDLEGVLVLGQSTFHIDQLNELDISPSDISRLDNHEDHDQFSAELRFAGHLDSLFGIGTGLDFVAGAYHFTSDYVLFARVLAGEDLPSYATTRDFCQLATGELEGCEGGLPVPPIGAGATTENDWYQFDYDQTIKSTALFGQATWYLTPQWAITPGLRFNKETKKVNSAGTAFCDGKDIGQPCLMASLLQANDYNDPGLERDETDVSPKLALQYFYDDDISYYASYAQGYKSGGFNAISFTGNTDEVDTEYEAEKARTGEIGMKGWFLDRTLSLNLTAYQTDFDNLQVLAFAGLFFTVSNAASATSRGLEADFLWITPYEPLRIAGSAGILDATYNDYPGAPAPVSEGINQTRNLGGQRIAYAPTSTATLTPTLTYYPFDFQTTFAVDVLHQGDQFTDVDLDPNTHVDAYQKISARLMVTRPGAPWTVSVGGTNLTDKRVLNSVTDAPFFPGTYFAHQAAGRAVFGSVAFNFGQ